MPRIARKDILEKFRGMIAPQRADRRRRRRHRPFRQMRGGGRHRPHRHLQFRPLSHGGPRLAGRPAGLRQCQRDRGRDGARSAAGGEEHAGAGRRQRHRSVPADRPFPEAARASSASPACRTSRPSGLIDGTFRANLEETGMGYGLEVEMIRQGPRAGYADHALCLLQGRGRGDDQGGGRHHRLPFGADDRRRDRRRDGADPRRLRRRASTNGRRRRSRSARTPS